MKILGLCGQKRCGKDTAAQFIIDSTPQWNIVRVGFADALKEEVAKACGVTIEDIESNKQTFRTILQWWGTDFRRKLHGEDYWLKRWLQKCVSIAPAPHLIIVPDVRFKNEAELIRQFNARIFRVIRYGLPEDGHQSETESHHIQVDDVIPNNDSFEHFRALTISKFQHHFITKKHHV